MTLNDQLSQLLALLNKTKSAAYHYSAESGPADSVTSHELQQTLLQCRLAFQKIVARLAETDLSPAVEQQVRPALTEGHRLIRLIGTDALRLLAAKQPASAERLRSQLLSQIEKLQGFVQVIARTLQEIQ